MAGVRRNLVIRAGVDLTQFSRGMDKMQKELQKKAKKIGEIGSKMAKAVTVPLMGIFAISTKGMQEMRSDLAKLETNAMIAGQGIEQLHKQMAYLNAVTGETDSNVEALSNLMASGFKGNQLDSVINSLAGAVIKFPDTLKIEGLADGLQETLATGKAIGPFSEMLERMGINLEDFNEGLANATASGKQHNYILKVLADTGLSQVNDKFKENNQEMIENAEAQFNLKKSLTELGTTLQPIMTQLVNTVQSVVGWFNNLTTSQQKWIIGIGVAAIAVNGLLVVYQKLILLKSILVGWYKAATIAKIIHTSAVNKETAATMAENAAKTASLGTMIKGVAVYVASKIAIAAHTVVMWSYVAVTKLAAAAQWLLNAAFVATPIGWIVIGVGALVTAFVVLWKKLDGFRQFWINLWDIIKIAFKATINWIIGGINTYLNGIKFMINGTIKLLNAMIKKINKIPGFEIELIPKLKDTDLQIPKLAKGGIVYGDSLVNVGEYANARTNPEVIAPLDKLQGMIGNTQGSINLVIEMDGRTFAKQLAVPMAKEMKIIVG